jgi:hypothetical protein
MSWQGPVGLAFGFLIALVTTPAGVSGEVSLSTFPAARGVERWR